MKKYLLISLIFTSCSLLNFMPSYNSNIVSEINATQIYADSLANEIIQNENKNFENYKAGYELLDVKVKNIYALELARSKGKWLAKQAESVNSVYQNWYGYHAKVVEITDDEVVSFRDLFDASIEALLNSENSLKEK